jgi:anti-sigma factor RsiW
MEASRTMTSPDLDRARLRRYLLGELPEDEQVALEERYFTADDVFAELLAEEDDLVDAYLSGALPGAVRDRFERVFLSTAAGQRRLRLARDLRHDRRIAPERRTEHPSRKLWPVAVAAAVVMMAGGGAWLALGRSSGPGPAQTVRAPTRPATARPQEVNPTPRGPVSPEASPRAAFGPTVFSMTLTTGLAREAGTANTFAIPSGTTTVRFLLPLARDDYRRYRVSVQTAEGAETTALGGLTAQPLGSGRVLEVHLPRTLLEPRTYVMVVSGEDRGGRTEPVGEYVFRVTPHSSGAR